MSAPAFDLMIASPSLNEAMPATLSGPSLTMEPAVATPVTPSVPPTVPDPATVSAPLLVTEPPVTAPVAVSVLPNVAAPVALRLANVAALR